LWCGGWGARLSAVFAGFTVNFPLAVANKNDMAAFAVMATGRAKWRGINFRTPQSSG
jgi:hypothetical protein